MEIQEVEFIKLSLYQSFLDIDNERLIKELEEFPQNLAGNPDDIYRWEPDFPSAGLESETLKRELLLRVESIAGKPMVCNAIWIYTLKKGQSIPQHSHKTNYQLHPEEYYSVAYYAKAPEGGANLTFVGNYCNTMESRITVTAETGKAIIFNSYVDHLTDRHLSDEDRMCISANYQPLTPDTTPVPDWSVYLKAREKGVPLTRFG
jgi:hypothetical protein